MKTGYKTFVSLIVSVMLILTLILPCFAVDAAPGGNRYPYVFVHGMMGWGSYDGVEKVEPYWGVWNGDMLEDLRSQGYECYAASVGKISSNWDRACELYAQLAGTVVDYGEVHSARCGHARYGRSYEGNALMKDFGATKINIFGHSLGGPTARLFAWLMENGSPEEVAASGEGASDLFKGGKGSWINSVTTFSAPHNDSPVANVLNDRLPAAAMLASMANILGVGPAAGFWDYQLEQFGLTSVRSQGIRARFSLLKIKNFVESQDHCGYDLTLRGAAEINEKIDPVDGIYYFSYSNRRDIETPLGTYVPPLGIFPMFYPTGLFLGALHGQTVDGIKMTEEWKDNDGMVPVISSRAPFGEAQVEFTSPGDVTQTGVWYIMPTIDNFSHVSYMGMDSTDYQQYYEYQMQLIDSLS